MDALFTLDNFVVKKWSNLNKKLFKFNDKATRKDNVRFNHEVNWLSGQLAVTWDFLSKIINFQIRNFKKDDNSWLVIAIRLLERWKENTRELGLDKIIRNL